MTGRSPIGLYVNFALDRIEVSGQATSDALMGEALAMRDAAATLERRALEQRQAFTGECHAISR